MPRPESHPDRAARASDRGDAVSRLDAGGARAVEPGWRIHGWAGDRIGTVVERTADSLLVRLDSIDGREVRLPTALVSSEEMADRRATLSVDTSEIEGIELQTDKVDLLDGST